MKLHNVTTIIFYLKHTSHWQHIGWKHMVLCWIDKIKRCITSSSSTLSLMCSLLLSFLSFIYGHRYIHWSSASAEIHVYQAAAWIKNHLLKMVSGEVLLNYCTPNMDCMSAMQNLQCCTAAVLIYLCSIPSWLQFILTHVKWMLIQVNFHYSFM